MSRPINTNTAEERENSKLFNTPLRNATTNNNNKTTPTTPVTPLRRTALSNKTNTNNRTSRLLFSDIFGGGNVDSEESGCGSKEMKKTKKSNVKYFNFDVFNNNRNNGNINNSVNKLNDNIFSNNKINTNKISNDEDNINVNDLTDNHKNENYSDDDDIEYCPPPVQGLSDDPFEDDEDLKVDISFFRCPLNVAAFDFVNTGMCGSDYDDYNEIGIEGIIDDY